MNSAGPFTFWLSAHLYTCVCVCVFACTLVCGLCVFVRQSFIFYASARVKGRTGKKMHAIFPYPHPWGTGIHTHTHACPEMAQASSCSQITNFVMFDVLRNVVSVLKSNIWIILMMLMLPESHQWRRTVEYSVGKWRHFLSLLNGVNFGLKMKYY